MHEMPMVRSLIKIVLEESRAHNATAVRTVDISIGEMNDAVDAFIGDYFRYFARDTIAENAEVKITRMPAMMRCRQCGDIFPLTQIDTETHACPRCGTAGEYTLFSGCEMTVDSIEMDIPSEEATA